jgi:hypothetical protein
MPVSAQHFEQLLAESFRRASWRVRRPHEAGAPQPDLIAQAAGKSYFVVIKTAAEGRRDRLLPLLAQAILEAQAHVRRSGEGSAHPLAVVAAGRIPASVLRSIQEFASQIAPEVAVGVMDEDGNRAFVGHGLEKMNAAAPRSSRSSCGIVGRRIPQLFSDLNQWMFKVLLAPLIPEELLTAPRQRLRNASELSKAAGVSIMSAFRFVRQLSEEGFLADREGYLEVVRKPELLTRWAATLKSPVEFPVKWIIKKDIKALRQALKSYAAESANLARGAGRHGARADSSPQRVCLGLFAAADALGYSFVHGVPPHIYMEREDLGLLRRLGLSPDGAEREPDAYIRIAASPEAVFRPLVLRDGVPTADILQVWADTSAHPSRGQAQANEIAHRALGALFRRK